MRRKHSDHTEDPKPGPDPERLKIEGDWEEAMGEALKKKKPPDGWPKQKGRDGEKAL